MLPENCPEEYTLEGELFHHVVRVLRYGEGKKLQGLDTQGQKYSVVLREIKEDRCIVSVRKQIPPAQRPEISIYQCLPKGKTMENIVRSLTELGVTRIIPVKSKNTIPPLPDKHKLERWTKICLEALQQSGSGVYTEISPAMDLAAVPPVTENEMGIAFHQLASKTPSLRSVLQKPVLRISFLIGPEGGFTEKEIETLGKKGYISVLMVENILKVDTAAIAAAGIIQNIIMEKNP